MRHTLYVPVLHVTPKASVGDRTGVLGVVPPLEDCDEQDKHLHAPVLRDAQLVLNHVLRLVFYVR